MAQNVAATFTNPGRRHERDIALKTPWTGTLVWSRRPVDVPLCRFLGRSEGDTSTLSHKRCLAGRLGVVG